jgi:hypothetical protein
MGGLCAFFFSFGFWPFLSRGALLPAGVAFPVVWCGVGFASARGPIL